MAVELVPEVKMYCAITKAVCIIRLLQCGGIIVYNRTLHVLLKLIVIYDIFIVEAGKGLLSVQVCLLYELCKSLC